LKETILFWIVNFVPVSIVLAIFEIWLEKHKHGPWGQTAFNNPYWEANLPINVPFLKHLSIYHGIVFLIVMPILFVSSMIIWSHVFNYQVFPSKDHWYLNVISVIILLAAICLGNMGLEDFLYFSFQSLTGWREPHALRKVVIEKDFAWFKDWLPPIFGLNIPGHWIFCPVASFALLAIREYLIVR
jgi:hypothetical protein